MHRAHLKNPSNHSRGMTLVSVLVAVAILGVLAAVLATIFGNMTDLWVRSNVGTETQNMTRLVQSVVNQPNLCSYSLRATPYTLFAPVPPGTVIVGDWSWDVSVPANQLPAFHKQLDHIEINPGGTNQNQALVIHRGDTISPNLKIQDLYLRPANPAFGEPASVVSKMKVKEGIVSKTYATMNVKLVIEYAVPGGGLGMAFDPVKGYGSLKPGIIDVTIQVDPASGNSFMGCYQGQKIQAQDIICSSTNVKPPDCPATSDPCYPMYYVSGFDDDGNTNCRCQIVCNAGGFRAAPTIGPGPGPSGTNSYHRKKPLGAPGPGPTPGPVSPGPASPGPASPGPASPGPAAPGPTSPGPTSAGPTSSPAGPGIGPTSGGCGPAGN